MRGGGREAEKGSREERARIGDGKEKEKNNNKLSIKVGAVLISQQKPSRPTHGSKGEKGKGGRIKEKKRIYARSPSTILNTSTTTKMTTTFNKSPAKQTALHKALLLASPTRQKRK